MVEYYGLDFSMATIPKILVIYHNVVDLYQRYHAKFDLIYGNDELQEKLAELVPKRINLKNVFNYGKVYKHLFAYMKCDAAKLPCISFTAFMRLD